MAACFPLEYGMLSVYLPHNNLISLTDFEYFDLKYNDIFEISHSILSLLTETLIGTSSSYKVFLFFAKLVISNDIPYHWFEK